MFLAALVVATGGTLPAAAAPFLYYDFESPDTTSDNLATDVSGNGRHGTLVKAGTGSYTYVTDTPSAISSRSSQSIRLVESGSSNGAKITRDIAAAELNYSNSSWSMSAWYKLATSPAPDNEMLFHIGAGDGFGGEDETYVYASASSVTLQNYNGQDVNIGKTLTDPSGWHHIAVVHIPGTAMRYYVDGVLVGTDTAFTVESSQSHPLIFGGVANTAWDRSLDGWMDDVGFYASALTNAEVAGLADGTLSPLSVPEPASLALVGVFGAGLLARRRRSRA